MKDIISIKLNKHGDEPVYRQLGEALAELITQGVLDPDTKLPPIRSMSRALGLNNATVIAAYRHLEGQGLAYSHVGSGTYVSNFNNRGIESMVMQELRHKIRELEGYDTCDL